MQNLDVLPIVSSHPSFSVLLLFAVTAFLQRVRARQSGRPEDLHNLITWKYIIFNYIKTSHNVDI